MTLSDQKIPVDIVLGPSWWFAHEGISFDEDFFYHPTRRVEAEEKMEKALYERWGRYGLGGRPKSEPIVGPVHLGAGYLLSEMLGCKVEYYESEPPRVVPANREDLSISAEEAFHTEAYRRFERLLEALKAKYGYLKGDVNWSGILNLALDVRGQNFLMDMMDGPGGVRDFVREAAAVIERFTQRVQSETGTTSISVNRNVRNLSQPVFLHSECSLTMISTQDYEELLMPFDAAWSGKFRPFGIHYCGTDPHRYAESFAKLSHLDFLDVGWGGDVKKLRTHLPKTFFNLRLSPVEIVKQSPEDIRATITRLVRESGDPRLTGVCCINMDKDVTDDKIAAICETVEELRRAD